MTQQVKVTKRIEGLDRNWAIEVGSIGEVIEPMCDLEEGWLTVDFGHVSTDLSPDEYEKC